MSRFDYIRFGVEASELRELLKTQFEAIDKTLERIADGRAKSLALTKLDEAYMWANRAIRDEQVSKL